MFQTKVVEKIKTHVSCSVRSFEYRAVCEITWKNIVERSTPQMTVWRKHIACWIHKAANRHTQIVQYSLLFHSDSGCRNAPQCYVIHTLPVLLFLYWPKNRSSCLKECGL